MYNTNTSKSMRS